MSQDIKKIKNLRKKYSNNVRVRVSTAKEGGYIAEILDFPGAITEAETLSELIEMVNDTIATIFEIPKEYIAFMPTYLPPIELINKINEFPRNKIKSKAINFSVKPYESVPN